MGDYRPLVSRQRQSSLSQFTIVCGNTELAASDCYRRLSPIMAYAEADLPPRGRRTTLPLLAAGSPIFLDDTGITANIRWVPAIATCRRSSPSLNPSDGNP